ncbi:hypothetical protein [Mycoplasma phocoeninasale]|uniref:hypothetical protein n=1 Tax=Mycoplasma phocoeninasale TaxID=2726117 RepID=UPI00196707AE|nr:hypothetical protein [Mycoplasma phocoeninasale]MBN0970893.1 hypothetical protein [Mycoplasma phocoeninasale]
MDRVYIIGISVGLLLLIAFIIVMIVLGVFISKRNLDKAKKNDDFENSVSEEIQKLLNENRTSKWIKPSMYKNTKTKSKFELGNILVSRSSVFLFKLNYTDGGTIEGDGLEREWIIHSEKNNYTFPNAMIELENDIKNLSSILPPNVPVIGVIVFNKNTQPSIVNLPPYILCLSVDRISEEIIEIQNKLHSMLDLENIENIVNVLVEYKQ